MNTLKTITLFITTIVTFILLAVLISPQRMYHVNTLSDTQFCLYMDGPQSITPMGLKMGLIGCFNGTPTGDNSVNTDLSATQPSVIYLDLNNPDTPRVVTKL